MKTLNKLLFIFGVGALLVSCGSSHSHSSNGEWKYDENRHWHVCADCGKEFGTNNHNFNLEVIDEKYLATTATCTRPATYYKSCECGAFIKSESASIFSSGEALKHDFADAYLFQGPSKTNYEIGDSFDWSNVIIKRDCSRTGCNESETIDNSKFTVKYPSGGTSFTCEDTKVILESNEFNSITVNNLIVKKKTNQFIGISETGYKTTCGVAPTITGVSSLSGGEVSYKYYQKADVNHESSILANELVAGEYDIVFSVEQDDIYSANEVTANLIVSHLFEIVNQDEASVKEASTCLEVATYWKKCACGQDSDTEYFEGTTVLGHLFDSSSVTITKEPNKKQYNALEQINLAGMEGTITCNRDPNHIINIDSNNIQIMYENEGSNCLHGEDTYVIISIDGSNWVNLEFSKIGVTVSKLEVSISGLNDEYKTTCMNAPSIGELTASNQATVNIKYVNSNEDEVNASNLVKGTYTIVAFTLETVDYKAAIATANLIVKHDGNDICVCGEVMNETIALPTDHKLTIDMSKDTIVDLASLGLKMDKTYTSVKVMFGSTEVNKVIIEGKITISPNDLPTDLLVGEHSDIRIIVTDGDYKASFEGQTLVATKIIDTVDEFKQNCAVIKRRGDSSFITKFGQGTYYVLGKNLSGTETWFYDAAGVNKTIFHSSSTGESWDCKYGFYGTFDGNNYSIIGGTLEGTNYGMFGGLAEGSAVKNLNIYNVAYQNALHTSIFGNIAGGCTFSNIFVEVLSNQTAAIGDADGRGVLISSWANKLTLDKVTVIVRNSDGSDLGGCSNIIRGLNNSTATATASAFCGNCLNPNTVGITYINWSLDNINTQLTFVWKTEPDNMYRIMMHDPSDVGDYCRILVNGLILPKEAVEVWSNGSKVVIDIKGEYMNPGDVVYVSKSINGNTARGVAPQKV